jgi:tetratricopeptide (TPR) repeat protein
MTKSAPEDFPTLVHAGDLQAGFGFHFHSTNTMYRAGGNGMVRVALVAGLLLAVAACAETGQERLHEYNQDGLVLYQKAQYDHARESFEAALALKPGDANILYNLGRCQEKLGQPSQAEARYNECLRANPDHADCRQALAELLVSHGRRDEAVRMAESWLTARPNLAPPYALDGWLWHQFGDLPRAQGRLQQALEHDSRDTHALNELALVYEDMHRPDRAVALYERSLDYRPNQPEVRARLVSLQAGGAGPPRPD